MLARIRQSGVTIMVSTPYMDEACLCDRIGLILDGRIIDSGTPDEIVSRYPYRLYSVTGSDMFRILKTLRPVPGVVTCSSFGCECHVGVSGDSTDESTLRGALENAGLRGCNVKAATPGIEDCFISLS